MDPGGKRDTCGLKRVSRRGVVVLKIHKNFAAGLRPPTTGVESRWRMRLALVKRLLVGPPMPLAQARHERLGKSVALAGFASDPPSSLGYATAEILLGLILARTAALSHSLPIALRIAALLAAVAVSYRP